MVLDQLMVPAGPESTSAGALEPLGAVWAGASEDLVAARLSRAAATTVSPVKPNSLNSRPPAALAPFLVLLVPVAVAWWRTRGAWHFGPVDLALTLVLAPQFLSFWPSPVDWKLSLRSWPYLLLVPIAGALYWLPPGVFRFVKA